jgi:DNA-binding IclR family transcriptional regulator
MQDRDIKNTIPAVEKTLRLIELLSCNFQAHTIAELANSLDISVTTCFRILRTLEKNDWIYPRPEGGYQFSAGLIRLLNPVYRYQILVENLRTCIVALSETMRRSVKISVRQGDEAVTIYRADSPHPYSLSSRIGARFSLLFGSSGTALLPDFSEAEIQDLVKKAPPKVWKYQTKEDFFRRLEEHRKEGCCSDFGGFHPSIYTMSASIRNAEGRVECSVTILGLHEDFMDENEVGKYRKALFRCIHDAEKILRSHLVKKE